MSAFHNLKVQSIVRDTANSVLVNFEVPSSLSRDFAFEAGQYLTFRHRHNGQEIRRNYSISALEGSAVLQVGIRKVDGGIFSSFANDILKVGDELDVMPPMGKFTLANFPQGGSLLLIAAGSGITPMISHIETLLARDAYATITLIYGNRNPNSIMFREQLEDIKNRFLTRFTLVHVLSGAGQDAELFTGRIDGDKVARITQSWLHQTAFDKAMICGPEEMIENVKQGLLGLGFDASNIAYELFNTGNKSYKPKQKARNIEKTVDLSVVIDGTAHQLKMANDEHVLDVARENNIDAPYSCKSGICSTCRCKIIEGTGRMEINHALEDYEVEAGYALSCQLQPTSDKLVISYDEGH